MLVAGGLLPSFRRRNELVPGRRPWHSRAIRRTRVTAHVTSKKRGARISPRARKEGGLERAGTDSPRKNLTPGYHIGSLLIRNVIATQP
jgi:hypothetical protein